MSNEFCVILQFDWTQNMNYFGSLANFSVEPSDPVCSIQLESYLPELGRVIRNTSTRYVPAFMCHNNLSIFITSL